MERDFELFYFDDLQVGQKFKGPTSFALDRDQIVEFGRQFDPQPFHLDEEAAKSSLFGGLAASGWHTAAVTMRLMVEGGLPLAGGCIGVEVNLVWPEPTRPGDVLSVESEVVELIPSRSRPERGIAVMRCTTKNQKGKVRQILTGKMMVPRRTARG